MRVLHIITGLAAGGAERQLALLLPRLGGHADVVTLTNPGQVAAQIRAGGVRVTDLGMRGNRDLGAMPRLVRLIRAGRYDIVHTHLYRACVYGRIAARLAGVRHVVATEHSLGDTLIEGRPTSGGVRALYRASERLGQLTVAVSPTVARRLGEWGVPPSRVAVVPNGIDAVAFRYQRPDRIRVRERLGIAPEATVIGAVSRLEPTKRFDVLLRAVQELPAATLLLVGEGSDRASLTRQAHELGLEGRVCFTGEVADVPEMLSAMDVYAAPSPQETFGLGVLEALANGLPVVYVACPALDDLSTPATDAIRRVASEPDAMRAGLLAAAQAGGSVGRQPWPVVGEYDITAVAGRLSTIYQRLLAGRRRREPAPWSGVDERRANEAPSEAALVDERPQLISTNERGPRGTEDV